jgi:hypothetical protein
LSRKTGLSETAVGRITGDNPPTTSCSSPTRTLLLGLLRRETHGIGTIGVESGLVLMLHAGAVSVLFLCADRSKISYDGSGAADAARPSHARPRKTPCRTGSSATRKARSAA